MIWTALLFSASVANAWTQPWGQVSGSVGAGLDGIGRGGGGTVMVALDLPYSKFTVTPTLSGFALAHSTGGLFQDASLDATVQVDSRTSGRGAEAGVLGRMGSEKVAGELHLGAGYAVSDYVLTGELDGAVLPGVVLADSGLCFSVTGGGVASTGPVDVMFALRWRRIPVGDGGVHLIGPTLGVRWGP